MLQSARVTGADRLTGRLDQGCVHAGPNQRSHCLLVDGEVAEGCAGLLQVIRVTCADRLSPSMRAACALACTSAAAVVTSWPPRLPARLLKAAQASG
jgi:hypothetical protein